MLLKQSGQKEERWRSCRGVGMVRFPWKAIEAQIQAWHFNLKNGF